MGRADTPLLERSGREGSLPCATQTDANTSLGRVLAWLESDNLDSLLAAKEWLDRRNMYGKTLLEDMVRRDAPAVRSGERRICVALILAALMGAGVVSCCTSYSWDVATGLAVLMMPFWLASPFAGAKCVSLHLSGRRLRNCVALLRRYRSESAVGAMIAAMESGDHATVLMAEDGLVRLLLELQIRDPGAVTPAQHASLRRALERRNTELIIAILKAFETIGDEDDVAIVEWLTHCPEWYDESWRIHSAARHCMAALDARIGARHAGRTLVRAASPPSGSLLRPAAGSGNEGGEVLLRASSSARREQYSR